MITPPDHYFFFTTGDSSLLIIGGIKDFYCLHSGLLSFQWCLPLELILHLPAFISPHPDFYILKTSDYTWCPFYVLPLLIFVLSHLLCLIKWFSSLISQNFLFLRIFVSLLVSAIGTLPHLCLWVQTSHYSFFLLYHYSPQSRVPWHKCCLGYYLGVLQFDSSVSLHYLSQIKLHVMCFAYCSHCLKFWLHIKGCLHIAGISVRYIYHLSTINWVPCYSASCVFYLSRFK